jgi:lysophospholipase L1-like esterase
MKAILCYGDSNTWGCPPGGVGRYSFEERWPGILQNYLGKEYNVIEEGLCGRTTCFDDPTCSGRNGFASLTEVLRSHSPIRLLILMLGTNDLQSRYDLEAFTIAEGAGKLIQLAKENTPKSKILFVSPPHIVNSDDLETLETFIGAVKKSRELAKHFQRVALQQECYFFDAATVSEASPIDGVHLDRNNHKLLADGIFKEIKRFTGSPAPF